MLSIFTACSSTCDSCCVNCKSSIARSCVSSHALFLCIPRRPVEQGTPRHSYFFLHFISVFISFLSSPFGCFHLLEALSLKLLSSICTSCCILITASVLLCGPSAAALTLSQFCPSSKRRKNHLPNFPKVWGVLLFSCFPFPSRPSSSSS